MWDMPPDHNKTSAAENSLGRSNLVALAELDSPERQEMLARILAKIEEEKLEVIRIAIVDTHGIARVRPVEARLFSQVTRNGVAFPAALFGMDSANNIFQNVFAHGDAIGGAWADIFAVPDPATFQVLPWAHKCGWVLSDLYRSSGERYPFDPRLVMQTACNRLTQQGLTYIGGVEIECHILKISDPRNGLLIAPSRHCRRVSRLCATGTNTCPIMCWTIWSQSSHPFARR
jgi:glutamine synthetase